MKNSLNIMKMVCVLSIILLALLLTMCGGDGDLDPPSSDVNYWSSLGPGGGIIISLAIDPVNTNTLYAGSNYACVYKSTDDGASWTEIKQNYMRILYQSTLGRSW